VGEIFNIMHGGQMGTPASYEIKEGRLVTTLGGSPFEVTVYKTGDKYVAARNREFGSLTTGSKRSSKSQHPRNKPDGDFGLCSWPSFSTATSTTSPPVHIV
jgi:hypothetical protein